MTVHSIEVHQVGEAETGEVLLHHFVNVVHSIHVALVVVTTVDSLTREDIVDLTNTDNVITSLTEPVHIGLANWLQAEVVPVSSPGEVVLVRADVWPGNDPSNGVFRAVNKCPSVFTDLVQFLDWNNIFVGRNLHYGVTRSVEDQFPGLHLPFTVIVNNFSSGVWLVNDHLPTGELFQLVDNFLWNAVWEG